MGAQRRDPFEDFARLNRRRAFDFNSAIKFPTRS